MKIPRDWVTWLLVLGVFGALWLDYYDPISGVWL